MISASTLKHLRFPFSFFLMPVFLLALSSASEIHVVNCVIAFILLHFFLYPASNGYNSYYDKDEESIGGLEKPPPVKKDLYYTSLAMDLMAVLAGLFVHWQFSLMLLCYGLVSKAYSYPGIRLKKMPVIGWLVIGLFQGFFTFVMSWIAIANTTLSGLHGNWQMISAGVLSSLLLWGSYPMTQIYQHNEDSRRGDQTLSLKLGLLGTFHFTALFFTLAMGGFIWYFQYYFNWTTSLIFLSFLSPVLFYFLTWYWKARKDLTRINYKNTMKLNLISSICLNLVFTLFAIYY